MCNFKKILWQSTVTSRWDQKMCPHLLTMTSIGDKVKNFEPSSRVKPLVFWLFILTSVAANIIFLNKFKELSDIGHSPFSKSSVPPSSTLPLQSIRGLTTAFQLSSTRQQTGGGTTRVSLKSYGDHIDIGPMAIALTDDNTRSHTSQSPVDFSRIMTRAPILSKHCNSFTAWLAFCPHERS